MNNRSYKTGTVVSVISNTGLALFNIATVGTLVDYHYSEYKEGVIVIFAYMAIALIFLPFALISFIWTMVKKSTLPHATYRYRIIFSVIGLTSIAAVLAALILTTKS